MGVGTISTYETSLTGTFNRAPFTEDSCARELMAAKRYWPQKGTKVTKMNWDAGSRLRASFANFAPSRGHQLLDPTFGRKKAQESQKLKRSDLKTFSLARRGDPASHVF